MHPSALSPQVSVTSDIRVDAPCAPVGRAGQAQAPKLPDAPAELRPLAPGDSKGDAVGGTVLAFLQSLPRAVVDPAPIAEPQGLAQAKGKQAARRLPNPSVMQTTYGLEDISLASADEIAREILDEACDGLRAHEDAAASSLTKWKEALSSKDSWQRVLFMDNESGDYLIAELRGVADCEDLRVQCFESKDGEIRSHDVPLNQVFPFKSSRVHAQPAHQLMELAANLRQAYDDAESLLRHCQGCELDQPVSIARDDYSQVCEKLDLRLRAVKSAALRTLVCEASASTPGLPFTRCKVRDGKESQTYYEIPSSVLCRRESAPEPEERRRDSKSGSSDGKVAAM